MRGAAVHPNRKRVVRRRGDDDRADGRQRVQDVGAARTQLADVQGFGAEMADLLAPGEDHFEWRPRRRWRSVGKHLGHLEQRGNAGFGVCAQDGVAARDEHAVVDPRLNADAGHHHIHV